MHLETSSILSLQVSEIILHFTQDLVVLLPICVCSLCLVVHILLYVVIEGHSMLHTGGNNKQLIKHGIMYP